MYIYQYILFTWSSAGLVGLSVWVLKAGRRHVSLTGIYMIKVVVLFAID